MAAEKGYLRASKHFNPSDLEVNVDGRAFMITGANSGLGKCAAICIAKLGGTIHMVCRDRMRGEEARQEIIEASGNQNVYLHELDLSRPEDIYAFVRSFESTGQPLHVLINNASCMENTRLLDSNGLDKNFATNTLGTHILITSLMPLLLRNENPRVVRQRNENPRVIIVSSGGMLVQKLNVSDLQFAMMRPYDGTMAYAQTKRQQVILTRTYSKLYPNIHVSCMHPGWADTPAVQSSMPQFYERMKASLRTVDQGADTIIWLAVSQRAVQSHPSGLFYQDRVPIKTHLPLAWTKSTSQEEQQLLEELNQMAQRYQ